tara:strand:- start:40 stop:537 length:498 start_codon:yes stop_codon:yes gene_type:complete
MEAPNHPSLQLTKGTISIWVNPFSNRIAPILIKDKHQPEHYSLWQNTSPQDISPKPPYWAFQHKSGQEPESITHKNPIALNTYSMLTFTVDDQMMRVFSNGILTSEKKVSVEPYFGQESLFLGFAGGKLPKEKFHGIIDDVRIYNRALSLGEVKALYDLEKPKGK